MSAAPSLETKGSPGHLRLESDRSDTYLEARTPSGWRTVCSAPCKTELWQGHVYRLRMRGETVGREFSVARGRSVLVEARGENPTGRGAGIAVAGVGVVIAGIGMVRSLQNVCFANCSPEDESDAGDALVFAGLGVAGLGILIAYANQGEITVVGDPGEKRTPMTAPRFRTRSGLEFSANGLHF